MQETVVNKPLSGTELKTLIRRDLERLLEQDGSFMPHAAYGRCAYQIIVRLHTGNALFPVSESEIRSTMTRDLDGKLGATEPPPLVQPPDDAAITGTTLQRTILSPNVERVREGLPVPVETRQRDGTTTTEHITYPKSETDLGDMTIADTSAEAEAALKALRK